MKSALTCCLVLTLTLLTSAVVFAETPEELAARQKATNDEIIDLITGQPSRSAPSSDPLKPPANDLATTCAPVLAAADVPEYLCYLPLAFSQQMPNETLGQYLALFTRLHNLHDVSKGEDGTITATIGNAVVQFSEEKYIATDEYFADPNSTTPGEVKYAVSHLQTSTGSGAISNFYDSMTVLLVLQATFGAPPVQ